MISGITAEDKVYDGTANAEAVTGNAVFTGKIGSDELTVSADGTFADKHIGTKDVAFSNLVLGGKDAVNYKIASWNKTTATITPKALSITVVDQADVVYGTAVTPEYTYDGLCSGDSFTGALAIDGTRSTGGSLTAGTHNILQNTLWIDDGNGGNNYTVTFTGDSFKVTPKEVTVSGITAENKVYDGTTDVTLVFDNAGFDGLVSGDLLGVTADGEFVSPDAAADITVTLENMILTGADKDNYTIKDGSQTETAATIDALTVKAVWVLKDSYVASSEDQSKDVKAYYLDINGEKVKLNITITKGGVKVPFKEAGTYLARGIMQDTNYVLDVKTETKTLVMDEAPMSVNADTPIDPSNPHYSSRYHAMLNSAIGQYQDAVLMQNWNSNYDFYLMATTSPVDRLMEMMYSMPVKVNGVHGGSGHHGGGMSSGLSGMSAEFDDNHGLRAALGDRVGGISELTLDDEYHFNFFRQMEQEEDAQMQMDSADVDFSMNDMLELIVKSDKFKDDVDEAIEAMMTV